MIALRRILYVFATVACWQLSAEGPSRVAIPFAFEVDGVHLPAGTYSVQPSGAPTAIMLRADGADAATQIRQAAVDKYASACSCLRFHHYADGSYVLSDVNLGQKAPSLELPSAMRRSKEEFPLGAVQISLR
ncbi:MAG: hypothetical protein ABI693_07615 [Bryobacteraceae bacterium]